MNARRHRPANVLPLEVWDVLVDARALYLWPADRLPEAVADVVLQLSEGRARRLRASLPLPRLQLERVVLAGGGPCADTARSLRQLGFDAAVAADPVFIGERGGRALLPAGGAVMEVGQTSIKYSDAHGRLRVSRPLDQVPLELHARALDPAVVRARTLRFLASAVEGRARPSALVLALPCEIEDSLAVAGCSYPWPDPDPTLVHELLSLMQLSTAPTWVLNDAELAAMSVALTHGARTLVLTLGLGLGGAYLT